MWRRNKSEARREEVQNMTPEDCTQPGHGIDTPDGEDVLMGKKQILIVDDNDFNIDTLVAALGDDYDLRVALDGQTALDLIDQSEQLPDLILLDIMMPRMDGYEVCRRLKSSERTSGIKILFLTAMDDDEDQEKGLRLGADDYIVKPFSPSIIRARVRTHLKLKEYRDHLQEKVAQKTEQLRHAQEAIIASMAVMAERRDPETGAHIQRTKAYVKALAYAMAQEMPDKLSRTTISMLEQAAPLHDIGKVAVPDHVLFKPGPLTREEFEIIKDHTTFGADIIRKTEMIVGDNPLLKIAEQIACCHHEKWDGSGYPNGFAEEDIPIAARLMAIADVYDALISERPYKKAFSHAQAVDIILHGDERTRPEEFDPRLLRCFERIHPQFDEIAHAFVD
ncbi:MAG: HD-GYP domain-containing protein [Desulfuromonadaceae bacterium]